MSPEWWRERYASRTPEQRAEHIRQCSARRAARMERDPEYAARVRERARFRKQSRSTPEQRAIWAERTRKHRENHPEVRERERARINGQRQADIVKFLIRGAKSRSIKNGYEFDLTLEWARARWTGNCELSGLPFDWSKPMLHAFSPSIDRIYSSHGYTQSNCRFILQALNAFKGSASDETMRAIALAYVQRSAP